MLRSAARALLAIAVVLASPVRARAGGWEQSEQSPAAVGTVGAQTARADDPSAVYYNPAGLAFQRGLGVLGGVDVVSQSIAVSTPSAPTVNGSGTVATPTVFVSERLGPHFAVGIGVFSNFVQHVEYPDWAGRRSGTFFDLTTTTINPTVAIRPFPRVAIGFGFDIVPTSLALRHLGQNGNVSGPASSGVSGTGLGGNVGVLVVIVPRWLRAGASYRSAVDADLNGDGTFPDAGGAVLQQTARVSLPLPHNFGFGLASDVARGLTVSLDARLTLFSDLASLTTSYLPSGAAADAQPSKDVLVLNERDAYGFRLGGEYHFLDERLRTRLGVGWDSSPVKRGWLGPLDPDSQRVRVGVGIGFRLGVFSVDAAYSAEIAIARTSTNPVPGSATYDTIRHVIALAVSVRLEDVGVHVDIPEYKH